MARNATARPSDDGRVSLETVRRHALDLRRTNARLFDESVRAADTWYLTNCREVVEARHAQEAEEREWVRGVLRRGLVHDDDPRVDRQGRMYWLQGMFPADVAALAAEWARVTPKSWPADVQSRVATAALAALDWHERRILRGLPRAQATREWIEWSASHPSGEERDLTSLADDERALYAKIAHRHEGEKYVEASLHVWYMPQRRLREPIQVAHLNWQQIRRLPRDERMLLSWARIGSLCDATSIDPIVQPVRRWEEIPDHDEPGALAWMVESSWRDWLLPVDRRWDGSGPPPLDPTRFDPDVAEQMLELVERDMAERTALAESARMNDSPNAPPQTAPASTPPTLVLDLLMLKERLGPRMAESLKWASGIDPFVRGIMEFNHLFTATIEYIRVAEEHQADSSKLSPAAFAGHLVCILEWGRDKLLTMLPPAERVIPAQRLTHSIDVARRLLAAYSSRPFEQLVDRPNRRLFHGPWVPIFGEVQGAMNDVARLITFWQADRGAGDGLLAPPPTPASDEAPPEALNDAAVLPNHDELKPLGEKAAGFPASDSQETVVPAVEPKPLPRRPSEKDWHVWQLFAFRKTMGLRTQEDIAAMMRRESGGSFVQGQVSKAIKACRKYLNAGGTPPAAESNSPGRAVPIDPAVIDRGERTDHRSPHQRGRPDDPEQN